MADEMEKRIAGIKNRISTMRSKINQEWHEMYAEADNAQPIEKTVSEKEQRALALKAKLLGQKNV